MTARYRVGRKLGRTVYRQRGKGASDQDEFLGIFDRPAMAQHVVHLLNLDAALRSQAHECEMDEVDMTTAADAWQRVEMVCRANSTCERPPNHAGACLIPGDEPLRATK